MNPLDIIGFIASIAAGYASMRVFRKKETLKATEETTAIYEGLNKALREELTAIRMKIDLQTERVAGLEKSLKELTDEYASLTGIVERALVAYFRENGHLADRLAEAKPFKGRVKTTK